jgi:dTDP-4-dehydrorhamnose reductase
MKPRLIITGSGGFVAGAIVAQSGHDWETHACSRGKPLLERDGLQWHSFDLLDAEVLRRVFREAKPHAVIHAAAMADINYCEARQDEAEAMNVGVTRTLAQLCRDNGAKMVYLSTDNVFDGVQGNYREEDLPGPVNFYAETKARAERIVAAQPNAVVVRVAVVMGLPVLGSGNSFLSRMVPSLEQGRDIYVPDNEIRTPIDVITLGRALLELAGNDVIGYIHLAGNDRLNRFAMVQRIVRRLGYSPSLVIARNPVAVPGRAPRPLDVSLDNTKARTMLQTPMRGLDDGIDLILAAKKGVSS